MGSVVLTTGKQIACVVLTKGKQMASVVLTPGKQMGSAILITGTQMGGVVQRTGMGPSIKDVCKVLPIFDPPPPVVRRFPD